MAKKWWFKEAGKTGYRLSFKYKNPTGRVESDYYDFGFKNDAIMQKKIIEKTIAKKGSTKITPIKLKQSKIRIFPPKKRKRKK